MNIHKLQFLLTIHSLINVSALETDINCKIFPTETKMRKNMFAKMICLLISFVSAGSKDEDETPVLSDISGSASWVRS